jgi:hypothetical protein
MEEKIKTVEGLLQEMRKEPYTPYRDACIGALQTFLEKAPQHDAMTSKTERTSAQ